MMSLNNFFAEKISLPISDFITGQDISKYFKFLMESKNWSRKQLDDFQNLRLKKLIFHAYNNVPYYNDLFNSLNLKPDDIQRKEDLIKLPILTKSIMKNEGIARFTAKNIPSKEIIKNSSSGSTGEPFFFLVTKRSYSMEIASNLRGWYDMNYRLGDKFIKVSVNPRSNFIKKIQDKVIHNLYLPSNPMTNDRLEQILNQIEVYRPNIIRWYSDPLLLLAELKEKESTKYNYMPKAINTTGNILTPNDREIIEKSFGCKIFDSYGCEGNSTIFECHSHTCYHSTDEYGITEVLDKSGKHIVNGVGKLISTDLWNYAHPFIRYDTQDLIEVNDKICSCGRNHLKVVRILGRDNEVLIMPSGRKFIVHDFTGFFESPSKELNKSIDYFQVLKKQNNIVVFKLVVNNHYNENVKFYLINYWQKEFGIKVEIEIVDNIPIMQNNKRKFIINE
ncbi:MAG: phenylacetate--CoA ligase family protein [Bacteroidales bacterium]|nr:phenylacetate--CoA ligase family protein [Bacteroidales bacterium]